MLVAISPSFPQRPGDDRELAVVEPPERDRRQHGRHDERDQHDGAQHRLERQVLVEQEREIEPDREFDDARDDRVEQRVEHREPEHRVVPQPFVVLEADELAAAADAGVGERHPDAEAERIGEEQDQERRRRQHEPDAEPVAVDLQPLPRGGLAQDGLGLVECDVGHCRTRRHLAVDGRTRASDAAARMTVR